MTNRLTLFACGEGGFYAQDIAGKVWVTRRASFTSVNNKVQDKICGVAGIYFKNTWCKRLFSFPNILCSLCVYKNKMTY